MNYKTTLLILALLVVGCGTRDAVNTDSNETIHPDQNHEHISVVPVQDSDGGVISLSDGDENELYTCGMHPHVVQKGPGFCPICGMALTPVRSGTTSEGLVEIDPVTLQNIGVRTERVTVQPLSRSIRTTGRFEMNEQGRHTVSLKVDGWIEHLFADYEGAVVQKGQPLLELYSPELVSTQEDYLLALDNTRKFQEGAGAEDARRLLEATRRRLAYWDLTENQIRMLEEKGVPQRTLTFFAPATGEVMNKKVTEGQQIKAGQELMQIVDISTTWLLVDVYEHDLPWIGKGTRARIELPYQPGHSYTGRIDYIYNMVNTRTRSAMARIVMHNTEDEFFRPGMYAIVSLEGMKTQPGPVVPDEALIRTGKRDLVIVSEGNGRFRPLTVRVGVQAEGKTQILDGLNGGEFVVTSAQFLIDSEARLQSAISAMVARDSGSGDAMERVPGSVLNMLVDVRAADDNRDGLVNLCLDTPHLLQDQPGPLPGCEGEAQMVTVGVAQALLHDAGYTNVPVDPRNADKNGDGIVYQSPMHWSVIKDVPGNCDICNMRLEEYTVDEAKRNLEREGYRLKIEG